MSLKDYWTQKPSVQDMLVQSIQPTPDYLKPRKPKGCKCHMPDARDCWKHKHGAIAAEYPHKVCDCPCHYDCGGDA